MEPLMGEIKIFAGSFAPNGWFTCEGQRLPINQYQALFSILSTNYGGDGVTYFQLPDLRSAFPTQVTNISGGRNTPYTLGQIGGQQNVILTAQQMPVHTHTINAVSADGTVLQPTNAFPATSPGDPVSGSGVNVYSQATPDVTMNPNTVAIAGGSQPVNITPPFLAMQYIIAWSGVYPSRP
ncbi:MULTISPECIES: tail fiber protein [unclassified Mucilaginibacter]|uniref:phage tail protein n=1 Tax=unclassified Mucilaginibacter TaxID=2617802 RepID=UPI002AC9E7FB|nr:MULTISPECIES: tail fiber protein [unclassified Mucilaginibacter]MEB0260309.1 tail fiber protein [Mucilaginibacter sp. 10I4]MEB0279348.1 tail fiber protein [Mucilaginibacter sp. 10B2]MEB0302204.1 tail fiber protein [Mucilaginibacter sp. 5C4]WPX21721.1 tail fiber protein [Mucilaginibacter sp. 5C4]